LSLICAILSAAGDNVTSVKKWRVAEIQREKDAEAARPSNA
jgi:hypothetical protein